MTATRMLLLFAIAACSGGAKKSNSTPVDQAAGSATGSGSNAAPKRQFEIGIALSVTPATATVTIDDQLMGRAEQLDPIVALVPGLHTLVVSAPGFKTYRAEFSVTDKAEDFTIQLEPAK